MSVQYLENLSRLQVPYVNLVILATANDVFAFRRNKARRNAICSIWMTRVSLHTFRSLIIPQANCRILRGCQHNSRVRRKLDVRAWNGEHWVYGHIWKTLESDHIGLSSSTRVFRHCPDSASQIRLRNCLTLLEDKFQGLTLARPLRKIPPTFRHG